MRLTSAALLVLLHVGPTYGYNIGTVRVPSRPALRVSALRLAADGDGEKGAELKDKRVAVPPAGDGGDGPDDSSAAPGFFDSVGATFGTLRGMWVGFQTPKLELDDLPEAVLLNLALEAVKIDPKAVPVSKLASMTGDYYKASYARIMERPAVKEGLPLIFSAGNAAVVLLLVRLLVPRLLAIESMNDIYEFAPELGLPSKEELIKYIEYANDMDYTTKFLAFLLIICVEKVTLVGEFLPVGIILPSISPVLFGGVLQGTLISAFCAAFGSSINFVIGKNFLYERVTNLEIFGQPPVKNTAWYRALSRSIEKDGFKAALLLRLAPVLPIPIDAHWYVSGCTPLKLPTFFCAYFVGALKATFLDAYLGSLLTSGLAGDEAVSGGTRIIVVAETVGILVLSILVTQYALGLFQEMMKEEGYDAALAAQTDTGADAAIDVLASADGTEGGSVPPALGQAAPVAVAWAVDEGDRIVEDAVAFVAEAQAAEAAQAEAPLQTAASAARAVGAAPPPEAERVSARLAQIAERQAEIDAKLKGIGR